MPVKRRLSKTRAHKITPEAVALFVRVSALHDTHLACLRDEACKSPDKFRARCADCEEYSDKSLELHRLLGLKPWDGHVEDPEHDGPCPDYMRDLLSAKSWDNLVQLRKELLKASRRRRLESRSD